MRVSNGYTHVEICRQALIDDNVYNNFKTYSAYKIILEHCSMEQGTEYLNKIKQNKKFDELDWDKYQENDLIGNPLKCLYEIQERYRNIAPTTLRYISTGLDIINHIQNLKLNNLSIVEIGGGYGGQAKILSDLVQLFEININYYVIIDIPEVSQLQKKYLTQLGYSDIKFESCFDFRIDDYDLLISNYGLSEFEVDIREDYIEKVVKRCKHYFLTWNSDQKDSYFNDAIIIPEIPLTGRFNKVLLK